MSNVRIYYRYFEMPPTWWITLKFTGPHGPTQPTASQSTQPGWAVTVLARSSVISIDPPLPYQIFPMLLVSMFAATVSRSRNKNSVQKTSFRGYLPKDPLHSEHTRGIIHVLILPPAFSWLWVCSQNSAFSPHSTTAVSPRRRALGPGSCSCVSLGCLVKKHLTMQGRAGPSAIAECPPGNWGWILSICSTGDSCDGWYTKPQHF